MFGPRLPEPRNLDARTGVMKHPDLVVLRKCPGAVFENETERGCRHGDQNEYDDKKTGRFARCTDRHRPGE